MYLLIIIINARLFHLKLVVIEYVRVLPFPFYMTLIKCSTCNLYRLCLGLPELTKKLLPYRILLLEDRIYYSNTEPNFWMREFTNLVKTVKIWKIGLALNHFVTILVKRTIFGTEKAISKSKWALQEGVME